jgi:hypothetical protein
MNLQEPFHFGSLKREQRKKLRTLFWSPSLVSPHELRSCAGPTRHSARNETRKKIGWALLVVGALSTIPPAWTSSDAFSPEAAAAQK